MNKWYFIAVLAVGVIGCSGSPDGPEMAPISGTVMLDGKPLVGAEVFFVANGFEGFGKTKESGQYSLVRGAPVGECKVYISKLPEAKVGASGLPAAIADDPEQMAAMGQAMASSGRGVKPLLPPEFSDPEKTKLSFSVPSGGSTDANFDL